MIKIELTSEELQSLVGLVDSGVKTLGLAAVKSAAALLVKLEAAVAEANAAGPKEND